METLNLILQITIIIVAIFCLIIGLYKISNPIVENYHFNIGVILGITSFIMPFIFSFFTEELTLNIVSLICLFIFGGIIFQGTVMIPNSPITRAVITKWGEIDWYKEKTTFSKKHGFRFIFLKGIMYNYILVEVEKRNMDLPSQKVITPTDNISSMIPSQLTYTAGTEEEDGNINFYYFLKSGGQKNVEDILTDQVREKIRILTSSKSEGPKTWQDIRDMADEAIMFLLKKIAGDTLEPINSTVPTIKLFQFYGKTQFYKSEEKSINEQKKEIEEELGKLLDTEKKELEKRIEKRWQLVLDLRTAKGTQPVNSLGITLNRFNIGETSVDPIMEKEISKRAIEQAQAEAEKIELDGIKMRIFELMFQIDKNGKPKKDKAGNFIKTGINEQQAIELIQSERGKVNKKIEVNRKEFSFDKGTMQMLGTLAETIINSIKK